MNRSWCACDISDTLSALGKLSVPYRYVVEVAGKELIAVAVNYQGMRMEDAA